MKLINNFDRWNRTHDIPNSPLQPHVIQSFVTNNSHVLREFDRLIWTIMDGNTRLIPKKVEWLNLYGGNYGETIHSTAPLFHKEDINPQLKVGYF